METPYYEADEQKKYCRERKRELHMQQSDDVNKQTETCGDRVGMLVF